MRDVSKFLAEITGVVDPLDGLVSTSSDSRSQTPLPVADVGRSFSIDEERPLLQAELKP
jgi:hypothetical protein